MALSPAAHVVAALLLCLYAMLIAMLVFQIAAIFRTRSKVMSFQMGFSLIVLLECTLRAIFWLIQELGVLEKREWNAGILLLFWLPNAVQWSLFSFMQLFFVKIVWSLEWQRGTLKQRSILAFQVSTLLAMAIIVALAITKGAYDEKIVHHPSIHSYFDAGGLTARVQMGFSAFMFLLLAVGLTTLGVFTHTMPPLELTKKQLPSCVGVILIMIGVVFFSRAVFDALQSFKLITVDVGSRKTGQEALLLFLAVTWEVAPLLLLLATVAVGPPRPALSRFGNVAARLLHGKHHHSGRGNNASRSSSPGVMSTATSGRYGDDNTEDAASRITMESDEERGLSQKLLSSDAMLGHSSEGYSSGLDGFIPPRNVALATSPVSPAPRFEAVTPTSGRKKRTPGGAPGANYSVQSGDSDQSGVSGTQGSVGNGSGR